MRDKELHLLAAMSAQTLTRPNIQPSV